MIRFRLRRLTAGAISMAALAGAASAHAADPCKLLTDAEVRSVFPGARSGQPERTREKYGIQACQWTHPAGSFALQLWAAKKAGVHEDEIRGLALGFVDPLSNAAKKSVRYEKIAGVGDGATAVVETESKQRGILGDVAMLVTQRGTQLVELQSSDLARGDRAAALRGLTQLAIAAVARL